jgi:hypothetical protein
MKVGIRMTNTVPKFLMTLVQVCAGRELTLFR